MSDELLAKAEILDKQFKIVGSTIGQHVKKNVVEAAYALSEFIDKFNKFENQRNLTLESKLTSLGRDRLEVENKILALQDEQRQNQSATAQAENRIIDGTIGALREQLSGIGNEETKILDVLGKRTDELGAAAKKTAPEVRSLDNALGGVGGAGNSATKGINSFADAIRALKGEIPELAEQLKTLDAETRINAVYREAVNRASSIGATIEAAKLRDQALQALKMKTATGDTASYLLGKLGSGKSASHISGMTSDLQTALTKALASAPDSVRNATTINSGFRSFERQSQLWAQALKKYGSPEAARKWVAPPGKSQHNAGEAADLGFGTNEARDWFHANAKQFGLTFPMGNEPWHIETVDARQKTNDATFRTGYEDSERQATDYASIIAGSQQYTQQQQLEQQAIGMTAQQAQALRYEQEMLNQAQQANIALTPQQRDEIRQLAEGMAQAETATQRMADSQERAAEAQQWLGGQLTGLFSGLISGSMTAEDALKRLADSLVDVLLQAALMGSGPLGGMFGGGGGILGGLFGMLGFSGGGPVDSWGGLRLAGGGGVRGPGTSTSDSIPAMLSDGEFVVNARQTAKHRALLEAINSGQVSRFASGGPVGGGNGGGGWMADRGGAPTVSINAPVTVNASGGTPEQNDDLARKTAKQMETVMRGVVQNEMQTALRPGGIMSGRGR
ncbi:M15 family metallopeptidase [Mesorhizobium sp. A556]